jgi:hypothetical protein
MNGAGAGQSRFGASGFTHGQTTAIRPLRGTVHPLRHRGHIRLTLACGPHHRFLEKGWTTRIRANGETEWIPPPHHDRGQPRVNTFHHPEKVLAEDDEEGAA